MFKSKVIQHSPHKSQHERIFSIHATQGGTTTGSKKAAWKSFPIPAVAKQLMIIIMRPCDYGLSNYNNSSITGTACVIVILSIM
jgi:hypothetical protein